jgi:PAT family beta-lactamase induction signal transducer AmpG
MILGLSVFAACYLFLFWVDPRNSFLVFACITWTASLGLALFDTCADGWAVDVASDDEAGNVQASMIGGKSLGFVAMSFGFGALAELAGFRFVFLAIAAIAILILFRVISTANETYPKNQSHTAAWADLKKPAYMVFGVFGILNSAASFGTDGLFTLYLAEVRRMGNMSLGVYGVGRGFGALAGAAVFALLAKRVNLRNAQFAALAILGAGCFVPLWNGPLMVSGILWGFSWGFQETAFVTVAMAFARGNWAATFFAMSMIFSNIGTSAGEALGAPLVPRLGYGGVFTAFALLAWGCVVFVPFFIGKNRAAEGPKINS